MESAIGPLGNRHSIVHRRARYEAAAFAVPQQPPGVASPRELGILTPSPFCDDVTAISALFWRNAYVRRLCEWVSLAMVRYSDLEGVRVSRRGEEDPASLGSLRNSECKRLGSWRYVY